MIAFEPQYQVQVRWFGRTDWETIWTDPNESISLPMFLDERRNLQDDEEYGSDIRLILQYGNGQFDTLEFEEI